jgi:glycosyltransferase involved in cell wall biosynthesis
MAARGNIPLPVPPLRWRVLFRECVRQIRRADHVFAVSQFTADCLMRTLGLPSRNITVVYNAIDQEFRPLPGEARDAARLRLFKGAKYVVVHVGKPSTYKNRIGVLRAFATLHERLPDARLFLVHAPAPEEQTFLNGTSSRNAMRFLPSLSRRDLADFYGAADLLLFPSLYEGFGWPPVEAMACGCPVVSSARGALAEVVGDAAVIINDPLDAGALAGAAISVLTDRVLAADLRCRGFANVRRFQADLVLPQVAQVYRTALA